MKKDGSDRLVAATNRQARHLYEITDVFEGGLVLTGSEVKSLRTGQANMRDAYVRIANGEAFLINCHISPYERGGYANHEPLRTRKVLLHKDQIVRLAGQTAQKGMTLVPLSIYFKKGRAKIEVGLAKGKKVHDKREAIRERTAKREVEQAVKAAARR